MAYSPSRGLLYAAPPNEAQDRRPADAEADAATDAESAGVSQQPADD